ncbi:MAG: hypothetical protein ACK5QS_01155 [Pseudanabaenaceae cyanobacterium]
MKQRGSLIVLGLCIACLVIVAFLSPAADSFAQNQIVSNKFVSNKSLVIAQDKQLSSASNGDTGNSLGLVESLEVIKQKMAKARFCYNESCVYRNITSKITPPATADQPYTATISAAISRPSASPDLADYHFTYEPVAEIGTHDSGDSANRNAWHLTKGEEFTDVADFVFIGDRYEIYGVHSNRVQRGILTPDLNESNIKAGYVTLYYQVLNRGWQT